MPFDLPPPSPRRTIFDAIRESKDKGHEEPDFEPEIPVPTFATQSPGGTRGKLEILKLRIQTGQPLWHPQDNKIPIYQPDYFRGRRG